MYTRKLLCKLALKNHGTYIMFIMDYCIICYHMDISIYTNHKSKLHAKCIRRDGVEDGVVKRYDVGVATS